MKSRPWSFRSVLLKAALLFVAAGVNAEEPFPPLYTEKAVFQGAMSRERSLVDGQRVTGLVVPHHLLVPQLIARGLRSCLGQEYDRIVLLSPDHFRRSRRPVSVTKRDFQTCLGLVKTDRDAVGKLLENPAVGESSLFSHEHGIQAILPFLAESFPGVPVVPVALRPTGKREVWEPLAEVLRPVVSTMTLIIQSTDFSHFLSPEGARRRDQETLRIIALEEPGGVFTLGQPAHIDSLAALYLQMTMQRHFFGSRPEVGANHNSVEFVPPKDLAAAKARTTSYMVVLYKTTNLEVVPEADFCFLGDTFFGRYAGALLRRKREKVLAVLGNARGSGRCIVNLEGVLIPDLAGGRPASGEPANGWPHPPLTLLMDADLALESLKALNVEAVSLANNHVQDAGPAAYRRTVALVASAGFRPLEHGSVTDFGPFRLAAFSDIDNAGGKFHGNLTDAEMDVLEGVPRDKPLFAFLHWGREWHRVPGSRENQIIASLRRNGVELIIGSHSHTGSVLSGDRHFLWLYSLGNLFFDQFRHGAEGLALDLRFFPQGTYFPRLRPVGNLYQRSHARQSERREEL